MTKSFDFIDRLRVRTAMLAIGRSTLRNQGASGMVAYARTFLCNLELAQFSVESVNQFTQILNETTERLAVNFPDGGKGNWGAARKSVNIFLRDALYSRHLCDRYKLIGIEPWLEVPLDNDVYNGLVNDSASETIVPRWPGIRKLTPTLSGDYQNVASTIAKSLSVYRVHLDIRYWRKNAIDGLAL